MTVQGIHPWREFLEGQERVSAIGVEHKTKGSSKPLVVYTEEKLIFFDLANISLSPVGKHKLYANYSFSNYKD